MEHVENTEQLYMSSLQCLIYKLSITRQSLINPTCWYPCCGEICCWNGLERAGVR